MNEMEALIAQTKLLEEARTLRDEVAKQTTASLVKANELLALTAKSLADLRVENAGLKAKIAELEAKNNG